MLAPRKSGVKQEMLQLQNSASANRSQDFAAVVGTEFKRMSKRYEDGTGRGAISCASTCGRGLLACQYFVGLRARVTIPQVVLIDLTGSRAQLTVGPGKPTIGQPLPLLTVMTVRHDAALRSGQGPGGGSSQPEANTLGEGMLQDDAKRSFGTLLKLAAGPARSIAHTTTPACNEPADIRPGSRLWRNRRPDRHYNNPCGLPCSTTWMLATGRPG